MILREYGPCPECGEGRLKLRENKKQGTNFLGCDKYPKCRFTGGVGEEVGPKEEKPLAQAYVNEEGRTVLREKTPPPEETRDPLPDPGNQDRRSTMTEALAPVASTAITPEQLTDEIVQKYICPTATLAERFLFLQLCKSWNLNPFKREAYLIKYKADAPASTVIGYEVFLKRAAAVPKLNGWKVELIGSLENENEFRAKITIYRKDWAQPFEHEVYWSEYRQLKWDYDAKAYVLNKMWREKPRTMLKKVAMAQGFRLCFPEDLGGMPYTMDEMPIEQDKLPNVDLAAVKAEDVPNGTAKKPKAKAKEPKPEPEQDPDTQDAEVVDPAHDAEEETFVERHTKAEDPVPNKETPAYIVQLNTLLKELEGFGRDPMEIIFNKDAGILARVKKAFGTMRLKLEDLSQTEAYWISQILEKTILKEQEAARQKIESKTKPLPGTTKPKPVPAAVPSEEEYRAKMRAAAALPNNVKPPAADSVPPEERAGAHGEIPFGTPPPDEDEPPFESQEDFEKRMHPRGGKAR